MTTFKKARDFEGLRAEIRNRVANADQDIKISSEGAACKALAEPFPDYDKASSEEVISGTNNNWIVLGRDRPGSRFSGYGGKGHTQAGSIDLVVGRGSPNPREVDNNERKLYADPNFYSDAARIHISQKTDIDNNFGIVKGSQGIADAKSGIGIKADNVRVVAREGIKLVTGTDVTNSKGGQVRAKVGVDIIAGNDDTDLQPMVKGENLVDAMERVVRHIEALNGIVDSFLQYQMEYNSALANHFHITKFPGKTTTPSIPVQGAGIKAMMDMLQKTKVSLMMHKQNLALYEASYLLLSGENWILSRYNNVN